MERTETVTITNMCMVYEGNRVLVQNRTDPDWPGITFPGGHVEKGESFTDSVIREVFEETGLTISAPQLCGIKDWVNEDGTRYIVLLYKTNHFSGSIISSAEGEIFWIELSEMLKMQMTPGMEKQLQVFLNDELSEHFFYKEAGSWIEVLK